MHLSRADTLQHHTAGLEGRDPDRHHRGLSGRDLGEDESTLRAPAVYAVELARRELEDRVEAVDHRVSVDGLVHRAAECDGIDDAGKVGETHRGCVLVDVVDDVFVEFGVQDLCKFVDEPTAVVFVDREDRVDDLADDGGPRTLSPSAFVIADN